MRRALFLLVVGGMLATGMGCSYEKRVDTSLPGPPSWVSQIPEDTEDSKVFVGIALADNILDERNARNRAMEDVRNQIAESLATSVERETLEITEEKGAAHLGQDEDRASYYAEAKSLARQAMSGVEPSAYYWEKWKVKSSFWKPAFTRYKYWVKAEMPLTLHNQLRETLSEQVASQATVQ